MDQEGLAEERERERERGRREKGGRGKRKAHSQGVTRLGQRAWGSGTRR